MSAIENAIARWTPRIGTRIGTSNWIAVTQDRIDAFAEVTVDDQWIHVDPARAQSESPTGGTIAHGFLTLSLASRFAYDCFEVEPGQVMGLNYGFDRLRFVAPVPAGACLRGHFDLTDVTRRKPTEMMRAVQMTIEIEGQDIPALVADWLTLSVFEAP